MIIAIANDHTAVDLKNEISEYVKTLGHEVIDLGANTSESSDYPAFGEKVGRVVAAGEAEYGILICGTGVGISLAANKIKGIRAAVCSEPVTARLTKEHNNSNIIAFGARIVGNEMAKSIVSAFLDAEFEGGRHARRVQMITDLESEA